MKKSLLWNILLILGIVPFVLPFILGIYKMTIESWNLFDWLIMYSYLFWPTYLAGVIVIAVYVCRMIIVKKRSN